MAGRESTTLSAQAGRREAFGVIAAGAAAIPAAANAAIGESPRFSVFGLVGDGSSMSEGAAYGTDQAEPLYSPYSVYGEGKDSIFSKEGGQTTTDFLNRKKAILAESKTRIAKLPQYIARKEWFNVKDELTRYMYETRGAVRGLAKSQVQKDKADAFFKAIEATYTNATLKKQDACAKAAAEAAITFDAFVASL
jgi:hypothetical protein